MSLSAGRSTKMRVLTIGAAGVAAMAVSACSPTYGTDKTANQQLVEDLTGIMSLAPKRERGTIQYHPRPELVKPSTTAVLPPPQTDMIASASQQWPESPEQRLRRIRQEAGDDGIPTTQIIRDGDGSERVVQGGAFDPNVPGSQRQEFQRRLAMANQGDPNVRRNLSEPPVDYRQPAATAPVGELGQPEWRKEREAKRATGKRRGLRDMLPW